MCIDRPSPLNIACIRLKFKIYDTALHKSIWDVYVTKDRREEHLPEKMREVKLLETSVVGREAFAYRQRTHVEGISTTSRIHRSRGVEAKG